MASRRIARCALLGAVFLAATAERATAAPSSALRPGGNVRAEIPASDRDWEASFSADLEVETSGPLTIEAHSFELDAYLRLFRMRGVGPPELVAETDEGGAGTDARLVVNAGAGTRYRVEISRSLRDDNVTCGRSFELSATVERMEVLVAGTPAQAHRAYREAAVRSAATAGDSLCEVRALVGLASYLDVSASYAPAREAAEEALALAQSRLSYEPLAEAASSAALGRILLDAGNLPGARPLFECALATREQRLGPDHPQVARSLDDLVHFLTEAGVAKEGRPLAERALAISERKAGSDSVASAEALDRLAESVHGMAEWADARPLYEHALSIVERSLGPDHPLTARILLDRTINLVFQAQTPNPEPDYERVIATYEKHFGQEHPLLVLPLAEMGEAMGARHPPSEWRPLLERAVAIAERALGPDHPLLGTALYELGPRVDDLDRGKVILERALAIQERALGPDHPKVAATMGYIGQTLSYMGRYTEARAARERALAIQKRAFGPESGPVGLSLLALASDLWEVDIPATRDALEQALAIIPKTWGPDHPFVAQTLDRLARRLGEMGQPDEALELAVRGEEIHRRWLRYQAGVLPDDQALRAASGGYPHPLHEVVTLALLAGSLDGACAREAWDAIVRSRAVVLDEMAARHHVLRNRDAETARLAAEFAGESARYGRLLVDSRNSPLSETLRATLEKARQERDRTERALAARSTAFREALTRTEVGLDDLARRLPAGAALVGFSRLAPNVFSQGMQYQYDAHMYVAFVLARSDREPTAVFLGPADSIESLVTRWREETSGPPQGLGTAAAREEASREIGEKLRRTIWDPVAEKIGDASRVFVVPDGVLNLVNFGALPSGSDRYLVEREPWITYLGAERDLVRDDKPSEGGRGALVMGGPDFDASPDGTVWKSVAALTPKALSSANEPVYRSPRPGCSRSLAEPFEPLPGARAEADEIGSLLKRGDVVRLEGAAAQEAAFKALAPGRSLVHVATHGFFSQGDCASALDSEGGDNPLRLSGLALAGANRWNEGRLSTESEDGILTAEEIAALDLSDVDLAVLSGCETGLGAIRNGEGVLGLRRAFSVAGVRALVMSLWRVQDDAAREWMRGFYRARLSGLGASESAARASRAMIAARRKAGRSTHPSTWGAFVATGE